MKHQPQHPHQQHPAPRPQRPPAFRDLQASELFCPKCQASRPVRERLLLILPDGELHEYRCGLCATSLGTRLVTAASPRLVP